MKAFGFSVAVVGCAIALALLAFFVRHEDGVQRAEREWRDTPVAQVTDFGAVRSLAILPLVNFHVSPQADRRLRGEVGVSYLVRTDRHTILFDLGQNQGEELPSPLEHNMAVLGIRRESIDALFLSHAHFDHTGGRRWSDAGTFSFGNVQKPLEGMRIFVPVPMTYPGAEPEVTSGARALLPGIATTGTIPRQLAIGRIDEQALVVNVAGRGLVLIVGCGHQTLGKLIARVEAAFDVPIYGLVGDLHYPVPDGRIPVLGLNGQRLFASGRSPFAPLKPEDVEAELELLRKRNPGLVGLGSHDSSDEVIARFAAVFQERYREVLVGQWIHVR